MKDHYPYPTGSDAQASQQASHCNTSGPQPPRESVQGELAQLADAIERVASAVGNLSMQLTPVLIPAPPATDGCSVDCQRAVPAAEAIAEQRRRLDVIDGSVRDLLDRLAL